MRICYKSQRHHNLSYLLKLWVWKLLFVVVCFITVKYIFQVFSNQSGLYFAIILWGLTSWIDIAQKDRINDITIDTINRVIIFSYYDINEGQVEKSFSFDEGRIKISKHEIYFYAGRKKTFWISKAKDGFDTNTFEQIKVSLEALTSPVAS